MQICSDSVLHHPLDLVYRTYRDRLPEIAPLIPDIREIRTLSREEVPGGLRLLNLWVSDKDVPRVAASVVKPEWLRWEDRAVWDDAQRQVAWRITVAAFPERVTCSGTNAFFADGPDRTRVALRGDLHIDLHRLPGVPSFLAQTVGKAVERFVVELVTPNLVRVNASLEQFLDAQG